MSEMQAAQATKDSVGELEVQVKENTEKIQTLIPDNDKQNEEIKEQTTVQEQTSSQVTVIVNKQETHEVRINALEVRPQVQQVEAPDFSEDFKRLQDQINELSKRLAANEAGLDALTNVDEPEQNISGEINTEDIMKHMDKMRVDIKKNTVHIATNNESTDKNTIDVAGLQNELARLAAELENLKNNPPAAPSGAGSSGAGSSGAGSSGASLSEADLKALNDATKKIGELENKLSVVQGNLGNLEETVATHYKLGNEKHADFEKQLAGLLQGLNDLLARLKDIESGATKGGATQAAAASPSGADSKKLGMLAKKVSNLEALVSALQEALKELKAAQRDGSEWDEAIDALRKDLDSLKGDSKKFFAKIELALGDKVDRDELKKLEAMLLEKLRNLEVMFADRFADKKHTKSWLQKIEFQLSKLFEFVTQKREGDDALLSRKPLGGWSCASCEKGLEQLLGKKAAHTPWSRMPYRDPQDRIARVGPGFSRMLSTVQPDLMSQVTSRPRNSQSPRAHVTSKSNRRDLIEEEDPLNNSEVVTLPPVNAGTSRPNTIDMT